jgi:hypothetical protein
MAYKTQELGWYNTAMKFDFPTFMAKVRERYYDYANDDDIPDFINLALEMYEEETDEYS